MRVTGKKFLWMGRIYHVTEYLKHDDNYHELNLYAAYTPDVLHDKVEGLYTLKEILDNEI